MPSCPDTWPTERILPRFARTISFGVMLVAPLAMVACATTETPKGLHFAAGPQNGDKLAVAEASVYPDGLRRMRSPDVTKTLTARPPLVVYQLLNGSPLGPLPPFPLSNKTKVSAGEKLEGAVDMSHLAPLTYAGLNEYHYIIDANGKPFTEIGLAERPGEAPFASASGGVFLPDLETLPVAHALDFLATLDQVRKGSYEARLLKIPSPNGSWVGPSTVLWLKSDPGGVDLIYILPYPGPPPPDIVSYAASKYYPPSEKLYTADEFLKVMRELRGYAKPDSANSAPPDTTTMGSLSSPIPL